MLLILTTSILTFELIYGASLQNQIFNSLVLNKTYDNRVPPGLDFGELDDESTTNITVNIIITQISDVNVDEMVCMRAQLTLQSTSLSLTQISDVNVDEMDFSITLFLIQKWVDHRLTFNSSVNILQIGKESMERIWTPDTYFVTSKFGFNHEVTKPNVLMHIHNNGTVVYRKRVSVKVACYMDFSWYPLDTQRCVIHLESSGFTADTVRYAWKKDRPVVIVSENLPLYNIAQKPSTKVEQCSYDDQYKVGFSCLKATIELQRSIGYYLIQIFIPDILIVVLSWVSFWLHPLAVPGRVSLGAVTVLTMSSQGTASSRHAPKVSYIKSVDIWKLCQILFVFLAMVEFSVVNVLARMKDRNTEKGLDDNENIQRPLLGKAKRIDYVSRFIFPAAYLVFNILFWVTVAYANKSYDI